MQRGNEYWLVGNAPSSGQAQKRPGSRAYGQPSSGRKPWAHLCRSVLVWILLPVILLLANAQGSLSDGGPGPALTVGVWKNITPAGVTMTPDNHVFCQGMAIDP